MVAQAQSLQSKSKNFTTWWGSFIYFDRRKYQMIDADLALATAKDVMIYAKLPKGFLAARTLS